MENNKAIITPTLSSRSFRMERGEKQREGVTLHLTLKHRKREERYLFQALVILISFVAIIPYSPVKAQSNNLLLNSPESGNQNHVACKQVQLAPGYGYSAQPGQSMAAYINPYMVCDVDYVSGFNAENLPPLNTSLEAGTTPGSFAVTPSGGAAYTIPILVPPGTQSMAPKLAVSYNSQAGDGMLGTGWSLSGLSSITRAPQTLYHDNNISPVTLSNTDRFLLDGARLIPTSPYTYAHYGLSGTTYGTEAETFVRVTSNGQANGGPLFFTVETKDGMTLEYGNTADSRIEAGGSAKVLTWLLNKVYDKRGNYMNIYYTEDNAGGEFRPDYIEYTGNAAAGITPYNQVKFIYNKRPDPQSGYVAGSQVKQTVLLTAIRTLTSGNFAHEYDFNYSDDMGTHLSEIIEKGTDGKQYNSIKLSWLTNSSATVKSENYMGLVPASNTALVRYVGDFNGDGFTDYFTMLAPTSPDPPYPTAWYLYLNNGSGFFPGITASGNFPNGFSGVARGAGDETNYHRTADCNGDGKDDLIMQGKDIYADPFFIPFSYNQATNTLDYTFPFPFNGAFFPEQPGNKSNSFLPGDFDGDGTTDIFIRFLNNNYYVWSFKKNSFVAQGSNLDIGGPDIRYFVVDMNGDGKQEILFTYPNPNPLPDGIQDYYYTLELTSGSLSTLSHGEFPNSCEGNYNTIYPGDFNGDGKTDLLTYNYCSNVWLMGYAKNATTTGTPIQYQIFSAPFSPFVDHPNPFFSDNYYQYFIGDYNGDGKSDIAIMKIQSSVLSVYYSMGNNNFTLVNNNVTNNQWISGSVFLGDYNGDGHSDFIHSNAYNGSGCPTYGFAIYPNQSNLNKVTTIANGLYHKTTLTYKTLPELATGGYTKDNSAVFPVMDIQKPFFVVKNMTVDAGVNSTNSVNYSYSGAKIHVQGKGFLGFTNMTTVDLARNIKTENNYLINSFFQPILDNIKVYSTIAGINFSQKNYSYSLTGLGNKRYYTYVNNLTDNDQLHGNTTTYTYQQNVDGNVINETMSNTAMSGSSTYTWEQKGAWMPSRLTGSNTATLRAGETVSYNRSFTQTNTNFGEPEEKTDAALGLTTHYNYELNTGVLSEMIVSGSDIATRNTVYEYDALKRFVTRQTNALGHFTEATYDNAYGNVLTQKDINGLVTSHSYDGFGRLKETTTPAGHKINTIRSWEDGTGPQYSRFKIETTQVGMGPNVEYFDGLGRTLRMQTSGFDGTKINVDKAYNVQGQVVSESEPYFAGNTPLLSTYTYYDDLRLRTAAAASGSVTNYTYSGNTTTMVTTTNADTRTSSKTMDASGLLLSSTDNGGTLSYKYHSCGKPREITIPGATKKVIMGYDNFGRQLTLNDPDAGLTSYTYYASGELKTQTDARNNTYTMTYDKLGRMLTKEKTGAGAELITNVYDTKSNGKGLLSTVSLNGVVKEDYSYDSQGRLQNFKEVIDGFNYVTGYQYDNLNRVTTTSYPSGFATNTTYNANGYPEKILKASDNSLIWQCTGMNERLQVKTATQGNTGTITKTYSNLGFLQNINVKEKNGTTSLADVLDLGYTFNPTTGNLVTRTNNLAGGLSETFTYDNLDRLTTGVSYFANGNINVKNDAGTYNYNNTDHVHALDFLTPYSSNVPTITQDVTYTAFNKAATVTEGDYNLSLTYGPDHQRKKTLLQENGQTVLTKYFVGNYEITVAGATVRELHYIAGSDGLCAIYVKNNGVDSLYYVHTDHLGSIVMINTDNTGLIKEQRSYDAWGRYRNPANWTYTGFTTNYLFSRGYTGHEHLAVFGLINMNGRMYDPVLGRMLSPDNYVQAGDFTQSYNRYAYCYNNPLKYTDPDGEWVWLIPVAIGGIINTVEHWDNIKQAWNDDPWKGIGKGLGYFAIGGGQSAATYFGGPIGTIGGSYAGDALNSLLMDGTLNSFDPGRTTQQVITNLAFAPVGNKVGSLVSKNIGNELVKNLTNQVVSQNINFLGSNTLLNTWETGSLKEGTKGAWNAYTTQGGWWKTTASAVGQGLADTYDPRTALVNDYKEKIKSDAEFRQDFMKNLNDNIWLNNSQKLQLIQYTYTVRITVNIQVFVIDKATTIPYPSSFEYHK